MSIFQSIINRIKSWFAQIHGITGNRFKNTLADTFSEKNAGGISKGFFNPSRKVNFILPLVALVFTVVVYAALVDWAYRFTWRAYRKANVFAALLEDMPRVFATRNPEFINDPTVASDVGKESVDEKQQEMLFLQLKALGLIPAAQTYPQVREAAAFKRLSAALCKVDQRPFSERPTVEVIVNLVYDLAGNKVPQWASQADLDKDRAKLNKDSLDFLIRRQLTDVVTAMLADYPGTQEELERFHKKKFEQDEPEKRKNLWAAWRKLVVHAGGYLGWSPVDYFRGLQLKLSIESATDAQVVHVLYRQLGLATNPAFNEAGLLENEPPTARPTREELQLAEKFIAALITNLNGMEPVKEANLLMTLNRGYEQFAMLWVFIWMVLILCARQLRRWQEEMISEKWFPKVTFAKWSSTVFSRDELKKNTASVVEAAEAAPPSLTKTLLQVCATQLGRKDETRHKENLEDLVRQIRQNDAATRWILVWQLRALPGIGFIGTVNGIALAMTRADALVRATTPAGQAAAVNLVAGNLGVAFSHTFIALIFGIFLSWFNDRQAVRERGFTADLERKAGYLLDPIGNEAG